MEILTALNGARSHRRGWTGRNIRVAMTDTGFENHPYFVRNGYNIERVSAPTTEHPRVDTSGHGTGESAHVLVMAPDCHFIGVKHNDYSAAALETALAQNPRIITNSWGWDIDHQSMADLQNTDPNLFNELRDVENIINDPVRGPETLLVNAILIPSDEVVFPKSTTQCSAPSRLKRWKVQRLPNTHRWHESL